MGTRAFAHLRKGLYRRRCGLVAVALIAGVGLADGSAITCFAKLNGAEEAPIIVGSVFDRSKHAIPLEKAIHQNFLDKGLTRDAFEEVTIPSPRKTLGIPGTGKLREADFRERGLIEHPMRFKIKHLDQIEGSIVGFDNRSDQIAIRLKSGEAVLVPRTDITRAARLKNEYIPPEPKAFIHNILSGDFSFAHFSKLDNKAKLQLRAVAQLAQHFGDEESFANINFDNFDLAYGERLRNYVGDLMARQYQAKNGKPMGDLLNKFSKRLAKHVSESTRVGEEYIDTVNSVLRSSPEQRVLPEWIQSQARKTMTDNAFTLPQFKSIHDAAEAGNIFAGSFVDSAGQTHNVGNFVNEQLLKQIAQNLYYDLDHDLQTALSETWVAAAKPHMRDLAAAQWPAQEIELNKLPSREEVSAMIAGFKPEDFQRLPGQDELNTFNREYDSGKKEAECGRNPYNMKCNAFSGAYTHYFTYRGIPAVHVSTYPHDFVLLPVQNGDKIETLIFDPSFRQMFDHAPQTHFLGTREELIEYQRKNQSYIQDGSTFERDFTQQLRVLETAGWHFGSGQIPPSFAAWFDNPEKLKDVDGNRNLADQQRDKNLEMLQRMSPENFRDNFMDFIQDRESELRARQRYTRPSN